MLDFFLIFFSLILIFGSFYCVGFFCLKIIRLNKYFYLSSIIGYSLIVLIINFFYFSINFKIIQIVFILIVLSVIVFLNNLIFYKIKFIKNLIKNILLVVPIFIIFTLLALFYGEQYYVFRGNAWDYFGYITAANLSSDYNFDQIESIRGLITPENSNMYFDRAISWFNAFPVFSVIFGTFTKALNYNIFLEFYLFKVLSLSLYFSSIFVLFRNFLKLNFINILFISFVSVFSFYSLFIYEIDSLRQLSTLCIFVSFLVLFQNIIIHENFKINELILTIFLLSTLYLMYNELLFFIAPFILFSLLLSNNYKKLFIVNNIKNIFICIIIFFILVSPSIIIMYEVMMSQFFFGTSLKPMWYVYFGSYFFGRISPDLINQEFISYMSSQLNSQLNIFEFLKVIFTSINKFEYNYVFLNVIPSFFGFYFLTDIPLNKDFALIYRILLSVFSFYLAFIYFKNMKYIFKSKNSNLLFLKSLNIVFYLVFFLFLFQAKIFAIIKLILYFFLIFFVPIFIDIKDGKIKYYLCILAMIFPIYKLSDFNQGITRSDSFPSIQLIETKENYNWSFNINKYEDCSKIILNINNNISDNKYHTPENVLNYFKYLHSVLHLLNNNFEFKDNYNNLTNINNLKNNHICQINEEKIN